MSSLSAIASIAAIVVRALFDGRFQIDDQYRTGGSWWKS